MPRSVEGSSQSQAPIEEVWAVWTDPDAWAGGPVASAELHGPFDIGSRYTTKLDHWSEATAMITRIERPRLWVSVIDRPGMTVTVEHRLEPVDGGTRLTERWTMSGAVGLPLALLLARRIRSTTTDATAHLARIAEARVASIS